ALRATRRIIHRGELVAVRAREHRDPVTPPELARDAPVAEVLHPVEVVALEALRHESRPALARGFDRRTRKRLDLHEPLLRQPRLDLGAAPGAVPDRVDVRPLFFLHDAEPAQLFEDGLARGVPIHPFESPAV